MTRGHSPHQENNESPMFRLAVATWSVALVIGAVTYIQPAVWWAPWRTIPVVFLIWLLANWGELFRDHGATSGLSDSLARCIGTLLVITTAVVFAWGGLQLGFTLTDNVTASSRPALSRN